MRLNRQVAIRRSAAGSIRISIAVHTEECQFHVILRSKPSGTTRMKFFIQVRDFRVFAMASFTVWLIWSAVGCIADEMRPIALTLNILVASIGSYQFWRAGHFSWKLIWPFVVLSVPLAFLGGYEGLPIELFKRILGGVLFASAARLFIAPIDPQEPRPPRTGFAIALGGGIGLLSGLTGTGGGIFLTPLLLICRWAKSREAAAVSAVFVLVNSIAGLSGYLYRGNTIPSFTVWFAIAAVGGGTLGSQLGSTRLSPRWIHLLLATALIVAGFKLVTAG